MASASTIQPAKHPSFVFYEKEPFNGGPPPPMARGEFITPTDLFYVRCHGNIPALDAAKYRLGTKGLVARPVELTLENLRSDFVAHTVAATLQCAGNRRDELIQIKDVPGESPWTGNAISHGVWTGGTG